MNFADLDILWPASVAGMLILLTHVPLGRIVLERGIVFIDLAVAQIAALGVVIAVSLGAESQGFLAQMAALSAALLGAVFLIWTERVMPALQEPVIGVLFALAASIEILLLSFSPQGAEHLKDLLVGQILWIAPTMLMPLAALYALVIITMALVDLRQQRVVFYLVFAITITVSVQIAGVFLVFASLIVPALATHGVERGRWLWSLTVGVSGYALGLIASHILDAPTGAAIVVGLALSAIGLALGRRLGVVLTR